MNAHDAGIKAGMEKVAIRRSMSRGLAGTGADRRIIGLIKSKVLRQREKEEKKPKK